MSFIRLVSQIRIPPKYRVSVSVILAIAIGLITSWATLTGHTNSRASVKGLPASPVQQQPRTARAKLDQNYGKLPLSFELNRGQAGDSSKFIARGPGYNIFLNPTEAVLVLRSDKKGQQPDEVEGHQHELSLNGPSPNPRTRALQSEGGHSKTELDKPAVLRMRIMSGNEVNPTIEGLEEQPGKVNYFLGNDSSKWLTGVPTFRRVAYRNIIPVSTLFFMAIGKGWNTTWWCRRASIRV